MDGDVTADDVLDDARPDQKNRGRNGQDRERGEERAGENLPEQGGPESFRVETLGSQGRHAIRQRRRACGLEADGSEQKTRKETVDHPFFEPRVPEVELDRIKTQQDSEEETEREEKEKDSLG